MIKLLSGVCLVTLAVTPALATAQGGRGRSGRGRGDGGQRGAADTATANGVPRVQQDFVDIVYAHRSVLQLTDSQAVKVSDIRMVALSRRAILNRQLDSMRAAMVVVPAGGSESPAPLTDSARKDLLAQRRALSSTLGELHDVDVNARNETLLALNPDQQKKAEQLEEMADAPASAKAEGGRGGRAGGGRRGEEGRPGAGMGGMGLLD